MKTKAFTMAEVLITIGIIGIIAAMTFPSLINRYQEKVAYTRLRHAYSVFSQAYLRVTESNGPLDSLDLGEFATPEGAKKMYDYFKPFLAEAEDCGDEFGCFYDGDYKTLTGGIYGFSPRNHSKYARGVLNNGTAFAFASGGSGCNDNGTVKGYCGILYVDINGYKNPNQAGVDYFAFHVTKTGIYPVGMQGFDGGTNGYVCEYQGNSRGNGIGCTAYLIYKGKMDYLRRDISEGWK